MQILELRHHMFQYVEKHIFSFVCTVQILLCVTSYTLD